MAAISDWFSGLQDKLVFPVSHEPIKSIQLVGDTPSSASVKITKHSDGRSIESLMIVMMMMMTMIKMM